MPKRKRSLDYPPTHPCAGCRFGAVSIWQPVAGGLGEVLARSMVRQDLDEGEVLFAQGEAPAAVHCLSRGLLALRSYRQDGATSFVRLVYPGDIVGFRSFLADDRHQTEATALTPSRVCMVARREARQIATGTPQTLDLIARRCAQELARARDWQRKTVKSGNRRRLAELILQLVDGTAPEVSGPRRIRLPLTRRDLAASLGVEPETVSRLFRRLQDYEVLRVSGRWVQIDDVDRLRAEVGDQPADAPTRSQAPCRWNG